VDPSELKIGRVNGIFIVQPGTRAADSRNAYGNLSELERKRE
jgi:hypothetical protein